MKKIYKHPKNQEMQVEVVLASKGGDNCPNLYTIRMRYPRIIHGEILTHRVFSRNGRSSRAVPVKTMLAELMQIPFVPWHWGKNQKGMQASEECNEMIKIPDWGDVNFHGTPKTYSHTREEAWLSARDAAVSHAEAFMAAGYHKQIVNRLLEPFAWMDTLVTSTSWNNFLHLRDHVDAEPHLKDLARMVRQAIEEADVEKIEHDNWHLPYITQEDRENLGGHKMNLIKVSAARCARISYKPFNGDASYEAELARYDGLVTSDRIHASPMEHQASPDSHWLDPMYSGNFIGWAQYRKLIKGEYVE